MGTFKYRESVGAPWIEMPVVGNIYTEGVRPEAPIGGFSTDTHDVLIINNTPRKSIDSIYYTWTDYENYISNIDAVELLILYIPNGATYTYCKGLMAGKDADNCLSCMTASLTNSKITIEDKGSKFQFVAGKGVLIKDADGSTKTPTQYISLYCVVKKGAA